MTSRSLILGALGVFALFAPDALLATQGVDGTGPLSLLVQLMGALYFGFAMINWTAKDSAIGGGMRGLCPWGISVTSLQVHCFC